MRSAGYGQWRTVSTSSRTSFSGYCSDPQGCEWRVRSENDCGNVSDWSPVARDRRPTSNDPVAGTRKVRTAESVTGCGVTISWDKPPSTGGRPAYQTVEVQSRSGAFYSTGLSCPTDPIKTDCTVEASVLKSSPYYLSNGDLVVAQVAVVYPSWTITYGRNTDGAKVGTVPGQAENIQAIKASDGSIDVSWKAPSGEAGLQYELQWNNGHMYGNFYAITQPTTYATNWNQRELLTGLTYQFKVRARSACGWGPFSDIASASFHQAPSKPAVPTVEKNPDECALDICWTEPADGGSEITSYKVQLHDQNSAWSSDVPDCGANAETCCTVACSTINSVYDVLIGADVHARVQAVNAQGSSPWSNHNTSGAKLTVVPAKMKILKEVGSDGDSIEVTWGNLSADQTGGSPVSQYKIQWQDELQIKAPSSMLVAGDLNQATISDLVDGQDYAIVIAAINDCGTGEFSDPFRTETTGCPQVVDPPVVSVDGADVVISWDESTVVNGEPVEEYEVLLKNKDSSVSAIDTYCDGKAQEVLDNRTCRIPMAKVKEITGLTEGDSIYAKVRALNRDCSSDFSDYSNGD